MQNKRRSSGPDKHLRGINVKSSSKRTLGGRGKTESEKEKKQVYKKHKILKFGVMSTSWSNHRC